MLNVKSVTIYFTCLLVAHSQIKFKAYYIRTIKCDSHYGEIIRNSSVKLFEQCGLICELNELCQSVLYDENTDTCRVNKEGLPTEYQVPDCGQSFKYAEKRNTPSSCATSTCTHVVNPTSVTSTQSPATTTSIQSPTTTPDPLIERSKIEIDCTNNSICTVSRSACLTGKCRCVPGYSYDAQIDGCFSHCGAYGTAFQYYPNHRLYGYNRVTLIDVEEHECATACINGQGIICRSLDYQPGFRRCHLSNETAFTKPLDFEFNSETIYRQRDCYG